MSDDILHTGRADIHHPKGPLTAPAATSDVERWVYDYLRRVGGHETPRWDVAARELVARVRAAALRDAAEQLLATDVHEDLCSYGPPGTCDCALGEHYRWLVKLAEQPVAPSVRPDTDRTPDVGTPDHPEALCHRCGGPNVVWVAPSPLWNAVMRGGSINGDDDPAGIVCPTCFAVLAQERGVAEFWRLSAERVKVELETVTPSGRVWDEATWMWRAGSVPSLPEETPAGGIE
jgi:hypothetical protein